MGLTVVVVDAGFLERELVVRIPRIDDCVHRFDPFRYSVLPVVVLVIERECVGPAPVLPAEDRPGFDLEDLWIELVRHDVDDFDTLGPAVPVTVTVPVLVAVAVSIAVAVPVTTAAVAATAARKSDGDQ